MKFKKRGKAYSAKRTSAMMRQGLVLSITSMLLAFSQASYALKISGFTEGWRSEAAAIVPTVLLIIAGIGVVIGGVAVISGIMAKKNQQPLQWQVWGVIGGGLAVVIPVVILAAAGSITSEEGNAAGTLQELDVNY